MKNNGFGSFVQHIVVDVAATDIEEVSRRLGVSPEPNANDLSFVKLRWTRLTNRPGDDEDVVIAVRWELGDLDESAWSIDWRSSEY